MRYCVVAYLKTSVPEAGITDITASHRILWNVNTYPCPRYLLLVPKTSFDPVRLLYWNLTQNLNSCYIELELNLLWTLSVFTMSVIQWCPTENEICIGIDNVLALNHLWQLVNINETVGECLIHRGPKQEEKHCTNTIFKWIPLNETGILIILSLKFVTVGPIDNQSSLVQIMAWHQAIIWTNDGPIHSCT